MTRGEAILVHTANLLVGGTGLFYAAVLYLVTPTDEFAVVNHPIQPHLQHLHVLAAPLLVFAIGLVWRRHAVASWRLGVRDRHRSGAAMIGLIAPMIASGYLLQVAVDPSWRRIWVGIHLATSALWVASTLAHQLGARRLSRSAAGPAR